MTKPATDERVDQLRQLQGEAFSDEPPQLGRRRTR